MKLEKVRVYKETHSGSDWDHMDRDVRVYHGPEGMVRIQLSLPTGIGNSFFTLHLNRSQAKELARSIEDSFEDHVRKVDENQAKLVDRILKLEEAQKVEEIL